VIAPVPITAWAPRSGWHLRQCEVETGSPFAGDHVRDVGRPKGFTTSPYSEHRLHTACRVGERFVAIQPFELQEQGRLFAEFPLARL